MLYLFLTLVFLARSGSAVRELCGQNDVYAQKPYLWNNNVWNADESGSSCTYTPDDPESEANMFQVLWQWPGAPVVRGYPHVEFKANMLPLKLSKLDSLVVDASWEMAPSSLKVGASHDPTTEPNASALKKENVEANVCIDIFADPDKKTSTESPKQMYEIMIWFGHFGSGALPVGNTDLLDPPVVTLIQDTEFTLYTGKNFNGQIVHSWVANRTLTSFNMDFAPLLSFLSAQDMVPDDVFLGTVQFGTETFSASSQVNFTVTRYQASMKATGGKSEGTATVGDAAAPTPSSYGIRRISASSAGVAVFLSIAILGCKVFA